MEAVRIETSRDKNVSLQRFPHREQCLGTHDSMEIEQGKEKDTVTFHLIKSPHFQTLQVDGAVGNLTPSGLSLTFYVERVALPKMMTYEVQDNGSLGTLVSAQGKSGIVRELQSSFVLDVATARSLVELLGTMLKNFESEETKTDEHD
jgi:hypothetical protein